MKRVLLLSLMGIISLIMFYLSRFWFFDLWPRGGLFGWDALRPDGGLLGIWLSGTKLAPFELLIWGCAVFLGLTYLQKFIDRIFPAAPSETKNPHD